MADLFYLKCPYCKQAVHVSSDGPGMPAECPACSRQFRVPAGARAGGPASAHQPSAPEPRSLNPNWSETSLDPAWNSSPQVASPAPPSFIPGMGGSGGFDGPPGFAGAGAATNAHITPCMVNSLQHTRPWVMLFAVLWLLVGVIAVIGALMNLVNGGLLSGVLQLAMSLLWLMPAIYLFRYAGYISTFVDSQSENDMEQALDAQKAYWKFTGITVVIFLALFLIGLVLSFMLASAMA